MAVIVSKQLKVPKLYKDVFADNTWAQIIKACQANEVPFTWNVADQKTMTINGTDYAIDIIGKNHDVYSDGSGTAPLTFQLHDCYGTKYQMNTSNTNSGGYDSTTMHTTHLPNILSTMPSEVQECIRQVNKLTSAGNNSSTIETIACNLFLLSKVEVFNNNEYAYSGEGKQYAYYSEGNGTGKNFSGSESTWWLRSPVNGYNTAFCTADYYSGGWNTASSKNSISFAFCF